MLVTTCWFLFVNLTLASGAPVAKAPTEFDSVIFTTPMSGFDSVELALTDEQAVAAEMQGLVQVSPAHMLRHKHGADAAFTTPGTIELNFQPLAWANSDTFAIYRFDRQLWQKTDITDQTFIERGVYTARAKIFRNGTFAVFVDQPDHRISRANLISLKYRSRILKSTAERSADSKGWYIPQEQETADQFQFDVASPLPLIYWAYERTHKAIYDRPVGALKLEQRDNQVFMLQRANLDSSDWKEIATPVHILSGSWNEYLSGGKITVELIDDSVARIAVPKYLPSSWEVVWLRKIQKLLDFELIQFEIAPYMIIQRGRITFDPARSEQHSGVRGGNFNFWVRSRGKWSVWNLFSTPISIWVKLAAMTFALIIMAPVAFLMRRIGLRLSSMRR